MSNPTDLIAALSMGEWLVLTHYIGIVLALFGVVLGDSLASRLLFVGGGWRPIRLVAFAHGLVLFGLVLLLFSGTGLLVANHALDSLPSKVAFKLGAATLLCCNSLLLQAYLMPLARTAERPFVVTLPLMQLIASLAIATVSLAAWTAIVAVAFVPTIQALTAVQMYVGLAVLWAHLFAAAVVVSLHTRSRLSDVDDGSSESSDRYEDWGVALRPQHAGAGFGAGGGPAPLGQPFALGGASPAPPVNDNPRDSVGHRVQLAGFLDRRRSQRARDDAQQRAPAGDPAGRPRRSVLQRCFAFGRTAVSPDVTAETAGATPTHSIGDVHRLCVRALFGVLAISLVTNVLMLTGPLFMLQVYDRVLTSKSLPTLTALFGLAVALLALMGLLEIMRSRVLVRIGLRIDRLLSGQAFAETIRVRAPDEASENVQILKDVKQVRSFVASPGMTALFDMPWVPFYFALLFLFHWALGFVALVGALVLVGLSLANEFLTRGPVSQAARQAMDNEQLSEIGRRNAELLQALGMEGAYARKWQAGHFSEATHQTRGATRSAILIGLTRTTRLVLQSAILAAGAYLVLAGSLSAGMMIAASIIMSRAIAPIEQVVGQWRSLIAARQGYHRLRERFAVAPAAPRRMTLEAPQGYVQVHGLFAGPIGQRDPVLKGLSFDLSPGDALGVLGPSGSGKSTLARVLVGIWPPLRGSVRLDGAALEHWPADQLGRNVGYLPQMVELLDGTVAENIARFDPAAHPEDIIAAARCADVHEMILRLPDGYNTRVGHGGTVLSGGHRQRIALARAIYLRPALIVLDEPNSNLDADGEQALSNAIKLLREAGTTIVVLAHRRKVLENVSKLLVLHEGRQIGFGAKAEILKSLAAAAKSPGRTAAERKARHAS